MGFHEQLKSKIVNKNNYNGIKEGQKVVMGGGGGGGGPAAAVCDIGEGGVLKETNSPGPQHAIDITEQLPAPHADADISMADGATPALSNIAKIKKTDTVIIGNGPSSLVLSYLLHGNEPWYSSTAGHPDSLLHRKLLKSQGIDVSSPNPEDVRLYDVLQTPENYGSLTAHFRAAGSMSYSTQALPLNILMDTLLRPLADIDLEDLQSRVKWKRSTSEAVPHIILGDEQRAGGQWAGDEIWFGDEEDADNDNGLKTLSYADFLSLPGYSMEDHHKQKYNRYMHSYYRPSRRLVADYYATYPEKVGISDVLYPGTSVTNVERITDGSGYNFLVSIKLKSRSRQMSPSPAPAHVIRCRNVVLATGIFSHSLPLPQVYNPFFALRPLHLHNSNGLIYTNGTAAANTQGSDASDDESAGLPLLVVGSGYTAADAILCNKDSRPVIHLYRWQPDERPSPLRGCHPQAYPGYAKVYKRMKEVALGKPLTGVAEGVYEGFPNGVVSETRADGTVVIAIKKIIDGIEKEELVERKVADIKVCIGRRGRLDYLAPSLCQEIGIKNIDYGTIEESKKTTAAPLTKTTTVTTMNSSRRPSRLQRPVLHPTTSGTAGKVWVQHNSLRDRVAANIEVTPNVFIIGSLTGDSLVRFAMGGCVYSAGRIIANSTALSDSSESSAVSSETESILEVQPENIKSEHRSVIKAQRRKSKCAIV